MCSIQNVSSSSQKQAANKITHDFLFLLGSEGRKFWEAVKKSGGCELPKRTKQIYTRKFVSKY